MGNVVKTTTHRKGVMEMKCKNCNGNGRVTIGWDSYPCDFCHGTGEIEQTEQEYLQSCDTEQLAELLKKHMNCNFCPMNLKCEDMRDCIKHIRTWLKQPHLMSK